MLRTSEETLKHSFKYREGDNTVSTTVSLVDDHTFLHKSQVKVDGLALDFEVKLSYDGTTFKSSMSHGGKTLEWRQNVGTEGDIEGW